MERLEEVLESALPKLYLVCPKGDVSQTVDIVCSFNVDDQLYI
jgi:hypothetical protein